MDQADFQQAEAYLALFLLVKQGNELEIGSITIRVLGDFDLNNAGSNQIALNLLSLDYLDAVLPAFEQPPSSDLSLRYTRC